MMGGPGTLYPAGLRHGLYNDSIMCTVAEQLFYAITHIIEHWANRARIKAQWQGCSVHNRIFVLDISRVPPTKKWGKAISRAGLAFCPRDFAPIARPLLYYENIMPANLA